MKQAEISSWRREERVGIEEGGVGGCRVVCAVDLGIDVLLGFGGGAKNWGNADAAGRGDWPMTRELVAEGPEKQ